MDSLDHVENLIVNKSEGYFADPGTREDLHVTIRIASEFYQFLVRFDDRPPMKEIVYVMETIRSGFDCFFDLAFGCGAIAGSDKWKFLNDFRGNFPALRTEFITRFRFLASNPGLSSQEALEALLALTQLEFMFLAQHFPSAFYAWNES